MHKPKVLLFENSLLKILAQLFCEPFKTNFPRMYFPCDYTFFDFLDISRICAPNPFHFTLRHPKKEAAYCCFIQTGIQTRYEIMPYYIFTITTPYIWKTIYALKNISLFN